MILLPIGFTKKVKLICDIKWISLQIRERTRCVVACFLFVMAGLFIGLKNFMGIILGSTFFKFINKGVIGVRGLGASITGPRINWVLVVGTNLFGSNCVRSK